MIKNKSLLELIKAE